MSVLQILVPFALLLPNALGILWYPVSAEVPCPASTVLVMGAAQYDGVPSPAFARRLDGARRLYRAGCAKYIVVSGGKQMGDRFTEGEAGVRYLIKRGVPKGALKGETQSRSSFENLSFSRPLLGAGRVLIVTDDMHAYRTQWLARHLGLDARVVPVRTGGPQLLYGLRELAALTTYMLGVYR